jgi:hypothetical protein
VGGAAFLAALEAMCLRGAFPPVLHDKTNSNQYTCEITFMQTKQQHKTYFTREIQMHDLQQDIPLSCCLLRACHCTEVKCDQNSRERLSCDRGRFFSRAFPKWNSDGPTFVSRFFPERVSTTARFFPGSHDPQKPNAAILLAGEKQRCYWLLMLIDPAKRHKIFFRFVFFCSAPMQHVILALHPLHHTLFIILSSSSSLHHPLFIILSSSSSLHHPLFIILSSSSSPSSSSPSSSSPSSSLSNTPICVGAHLIIADISNPEQYKDKLKGIDVILSAVGMHFSPSSV